MFYYCFGLWAEQQCGVPDLLEDLSGALKDVANGDLIVLLEDFNDSETCA